MIPHHDLRLASDGLLGFDSILLISAVCCVIGLIWAVVNYFHIRSITIYENNPYYPISPDQRSVLLETG